jgi:hypothetical protein
MSGGYSKEQKAHLAQKAEQIFAAEQRVRMAIDEAATIAKRESKAPQGRAKRPAPGRASRVSHPRFLVESGS